MRGMYAVMVYTLFYVLDQNSSCTEGFLSEQTLEMIAQSSRQNSQAPLPVFEEFNTHLHSNRLHIIPDMMITASGLLTKWIFAAKFKYDGKEESWPELQIWRKSSESGNQYIKISGTSMEPRSVAGYLNVYEYDLSAKKSQVEVKAGDVLGVYQPNSDDTQYTLGFLSEGSSIDIPANYIIYGVDESVQEFNININKHEKQFLLPLVLAQIQGKRSTVCISKQPLCLL